VSCGTGNAVDVICTSLRSWLDVVL